MLLVIASHFIAAVIPFGLYIIYNLCTNSNFSKHKNLQKELPGVGISTVDYELPMETEKQYLNRLCTIHPEAYKAYKEANKIILNEPDRYINMLILKYKNGEITASTNRHILEFSNGTEIWIENKYYSYGYIWSCPNRPDLKFGKHKGCVSLYTFMCIVDLELELDSFSLWKQLHDDYTNRSKFKQLISRIK